MQSTCQANVPDQDRKCCYLLQSHFPEMMVHTIIFRCPASSKAQLVQSATRCVGRMLPGGWTQKLTQSCMWLDDRDVIAGVLQNGHGSCGMLRSENMRCA